MKIVYLGIILVFSLIAMSHTKPVHADSTDPVQILDVQVEPSMLQVNDTFLISTTILNSFPYPIYLTSGSCTPAFSVSFDTHAKQVHPNMACTLEAIQQKVDPQGEVTISNSNKPGILYQTVLAGTANANITISYSAKKQTATDYSNIDYTASKSFQFVIHGSNETSQKPPAYLPPPLLTPLKQFQSGVVAKDVTCKQGLWLIFKTSDGSPACVIPDTAYVLIERGWTKEISQTSLNTSSLDSFAPCDTPYPQSNVGVAVLYMQPNSTGKICATYYDPNSSIQSSIRVFAAKDEQQQASEIIASAYPNIIPTGNSTLEYTIKTGNQAGLYGMSFFCNNIPLVVGYDNQSRIILDDFPWLYNSDTCLSQNNVFQITGLSGIHVKYITVAHRG